MLDEQRQIEALAADLFNVAVPEGGTVVLLKDDGARVLVKTRSEAWVLPSGPAVVQLEEFSGCYRLTRVLVIREYLPQLPPGVRIAVDQVHVDGQ